MEILTKVTHFLARSQEICEDLRSKVSKNYEKVKTKHPAGFYFGKVDCAKKVARLNNIIAVTLMMTIYYNCGNQREHSKVSLLYSMNFSDF